MLVENSFDLVESLLTDSHLQWCHITSAFGALWKTALLVSHLKNFRKLALEFLVQSYVEVVDVFFLEEASLRDKVKEVSATTTKLQTGR